MPDDLQATQKEERNAGLLLIAASAAALLVANSSLAGTYHHLLEARLGPALPRFGPLSVHQWIADGLMAIFFLLVGLEVKREWYDGRLSTPAERRLPIVAATAGMIVPALVYLDRYRTRSGAGQGLGYSRPRPTSLSPSESLRCLEAAPIRRSSFCS